MNHDSKPQKSRTSQEQRSLRNVVVHRPMQREFTLITIAIMMFSAVAVSYMIHSTLQEIISENVSGYGKIGAYNVLSDASYELIVRVTLIMFVTIISIGIFGVFFLHRVAGPVYRFHQLVRKLGVNDIPAQDFHLRQKDFFKEVAAELNILLKALRQKKTTIDQIKALASSASSQTNPEEVRKKLEEIRTIANN